MMARTKRDRRSYSAGEWGRNRVRVFADPKTGLYQIEWRENGRRLTRSLKHRDWARAKRQADEAAAGLAVHEPIAKAEAEPKPLTLGTLFDIYGEEVTPTKARRPACTTGQQQRCSSGSSEGTEDPRRYRGETGTGSSESGVRAGSVRVESPYPTGPSERTSRY